MVVVVVLGDMGERVIVPRNFQSQVILNCHEPGEYSQTDCGGGEDHDDPDVELEFGPVVPAGSAVVDSHCHFGLVFVPLGVGWW